MPRRPYEESRSYTYIKDMLATVDLFYGIAAKRHKLEENETKKRKAEDDDDEETRNVAGRS